MSGTPDPGPPRTIVAIDFGLRRIGVAVGQEITRSASALCTVGNGDAGPDWQRLEAVIGEWRPDRIVVGMPMLADGSEAALATRIREFCNELARFDLPVDTVNERHSSREASERLVTARRDGRRGRIARGDIDAAAAALIAERWLAQELLPAADSE